MKNKHFLNFSDNDFTYPWDGEEYTFKAKESKLLPENMADHYAKHLVDKVMREAKLITDHHTRVDYIARCFPAGEGNEEMSDYRATVEQLNSEPVVTRKTIMAELDEKKIDYKPTMKKAELESLLETPKEFEGLNEAVSV